MARPRRIDQLGRVVIPAELRHALSIRDGDLVDIGAKNGAIVVTKVRPACVVCGNTRDLTHIRDKEICAVCLRVIRRACGSSIESEHLDGVSAA